MATLEELEKRLRALEDLEAIRRLKARYAILCDEKYFEGKPKGQDDLEAIANKVANLFTTDGVWDGGKGLGIARGRKEIFDHFRRVKMTFAVHYLLNPLITVDGNQAKARWYLLVPGVTPDNTAVWLSGWQDDEYVKIEGQWLQSSMKMSINFLTPYDQGWAKKRMLGQ